MNAEDDNGLLRLSLRIGLNGQDHARKRPLHPILSVVLGRARTANLDLTRYLAYYLVRQIANADQYFPDQT